jgi:hypothetical protein
MGRFAELAERHWRTHLPAGYAEIADRAAFFAELEAEAERQVFELEDALAGPDVPGESFLEKAGRLRMARHTAEASGAGAAAARAVELTGPASPRGSGGVSNAGLVSKYDAGQISCNAPAAAPRPPPAPPPDAVGGHGRRLRDRA